MHLHRHQQQQWAQPLCRLPQPFYVLSSSEELGVCRADRIGSFKGCWKYFEKYFVRVFENALKPLLGTDKTNSQNSSREITMASYLQGWHLSTYEVIAFPKTLKSLHSKWCDILIKAQSQPSTSTHAATE